jgi:1,4-alpha-glucan branching enzyme
MAKARLTNRSKKTRATFSSETPAAQEVILCGDFNNWNIKTHPMKKDKSGVWRKTLMLSPGRYEYKFLVDGRWLHDPKNDKTCPNPFGTRNSVLTIS